MADVLGVLSGVPLFSVATGPERAELAATSFVKRLTRGQVLFLAGEPSDHVFVVASGRMKVLVTSDRGETLLLAVVGAGETLGELGVLDGQPRSADVEALDDAQLVCVPATALRTLLARSPGLCLAVAEELAGRLRGLTGSAADLVFLDLPRRLAKLLVARELRVEMAQSEMAAQLGVTRPSLNRSLSSFQQRGWITVGRGSVEVLDAAALSRFAAS